MQKLSSFLSAAYSDANDGWIITCWTMLLTTVLEVASMDSVRKICDTPSGRTLYFQGIALNIVNQVMLGPLSYQLVNEYFMTDDADDASILGRAFSVLLILLGQALGYYLAHFWMHTPSMYWAHRFHHKFTYVVPVTANAVSLSEFMIAYMLPFIVGSALIRPERGSMAVAVCIISLNNLLIHTPALGDLSARCVPWLFVSTADHLEHHRRWTTHYAAPTISIDRILGAILGEAKPRRGATSSFANDNNNNKSGNNKTEGPTRGKKLNSNNNCAGNEQVATSCTKQWRAG